MSQRSHASEKHFSDHAKLGVSASERVGRLPDSESDEIKVWADIIAKLPMHPGDRGLDIGCGCGTIAGFLAAKAAEDGFTITLMDFEKPIELLKTLIPGAREPSVEFRVGAFPTHVAEDEYFDFILMYSVLHYMDDLSGSVEAAVSRLKPGGRLLLGDIPNLSRKGRFLASNQGRAFDAAYKSIPLETVPIYANHHDFVSQQLAAGAPALTDGWIVDLVRRQRDRGLEASILPQPNDLPFSRTREDLLIIRPHG